MTTPYAPEQAGLEIVPPGLEAVPDHALQAATPEKELGWAAVRERVGVGSVETPQDEGLPVAEVEAMKNVQVNQHIARLEGNIPFTRSKRFLYIVLALVAVPIIIVAVVVGAVFGSRAHKSTGAVGSLGPGINTISFGGGGGGGGGSQPTGTSAFATIQTKSPIAVTGWRTGSDYSIRLIYQDADGYLRMNPYDTSVNGKTGLWGPEQKFDQVKQGTPVAASAFDYAYFFSGETDTTTNEPQLEVFFIDADGVVQERNWPWEAINALNGSLSNLVFPVEPGPNSRMVAYWPTILYQDAAGNLQEILYNRTLDGEDLGWNQIALGTVGQNPSGLAVTAVTSDLTANHGPPNVFGISAFYQTIDGNLGDASVYSSQGASWTLNTIAKAIPSGASMSAFSVPRANTGTAMNTYVLYQDTDNSIKFLYQVDTNGWQGPKTDPAFNNADAGTSIACLTPTAWPPSNLQADYTMSRCYFQANGGRLREVSYDGTAWTIIGNVTVTTS